MIKHKMLKKFRREKGASTKNCHLMLLLAPVIINALPSLVYED